MLASANALFSVDVELVSDLDKKLKGGRFSSLCGFCCEVARVSLLAVFLTRVCSLVSFFLFKTHKLKSKAAEKVQRVESACNMLVYEVCEMLRDNLVAEVFAISTAVLVGFSASRLPAKLSPVVQLWRRVAKVFICW